MKSTDLRIGNYVKRCSLGMEIMIPHVIDKVTSIGMFGNVGFNSNPQIGECEISAIHCTGIHLTPEILEKCGFKMSITKTCYGFITETGKSRLSVFTNGVFKVESTDIESEVKYLHQLQNLYFALVGKELIVKL